MSEQDKDVKEFEEVSKVDEDDTEDEESDEDDSDSEEDSETDETSKDSEKDTHTDPSTDKKPDSEDDETSKEDESDTEDDDKSEEENKPLKDCIVETPREKALRLENQRLRDGNRRKKSDDLFAGSEEKPVKKKQEMSEDKKERLKKYDPKEIENLREVLDVMADDLGFVKKDEYNKSSYEGQAKDILDDFLEDHQEYDPTNDKDDVLWNRFQSEFSLYKRPENPRDLKKLFKKIHNDIVGIKPASDLRKIEAKKEKIDSASHSASKSKSTKKEQIVDRSNSTVDKETARKGLKGFTDEEIDELLS